MNRMMILSGLPASGKTTYAKELESTPLSNFVRVSWDDIRNETPDYKYSKAAEKTVKEIAITRARILASQGKNIIIDNTNLDNETIGKWTRLSAELKMAVEFKQFITPVFECIRRDSLRTGRAQVGPAVICRMALNNGLIEWNYGMRKIVIVDMDGTLADCSHRRREKLKPCEPCKGKGTVQDYNSQTGVWNDTFICQHCSGFGGVPGTDWDHYFRHDLIESDPPFEHIVNWVRELAKDYLIAIVSGRPENKCAIPTVNWLRKNEVPFDYIFMRESRDMRDDTIVKQEILDKMPKKQILMAIDDRNRVVDMWRKNKIKCIQVVDREAGDF